MPFVIRKIEPRYLCRGHVPQGAAGQNLPVGAELEAVANGALTASLKQLASLLSTAEDIFAELTAEVTLLADRSGLLRQRIVRVEEKLATVDPKKIPVPESDICTFAARTDHFHMKNEPMTSLFTADSRPRALKELYDAAAIVAVKSLDSLRRDGLSMDMFMCTPVLGKRRRDKSLDIESRVPAAIEDLRRWTSAEALGDITVPPDCMSRILGDTTNDSGVDHKLPSPEEQVQAIALKFPAELVAVDVSGRRFDRMSMRRRSLLSGPETQESAVKRRSRPRRPRGKRRNTIAGTDQKEIRQAAGEETTVDEPEEQLSTASSRTHRSASTDILGSAKKESLVEKKSHFNTLKAWGMSRLKLINPKSNQQSADVGANSSNDEKTSQLKSPEETNIYETVANKRRKDKSHERKPSSSSSSCKSTSSIPVGAPVAEKQNNVRLRESAAQRRERRKGTRDDAPHSSSGNWSASSESGRTSIGSETTTTTHPPRSTTTASIGTSSTSLSHMRRLKGRDTSASSSVTSEGTLTPDIIQDITVIPFSDDGETSSVYSCDTEGYYTSFHVDSGLKTLREEEVLPQTPFTKSNDVSSELTSPVVENEYELFGRGSTSTTTSSAGTVCTALLAPPPPERKSSLTVVAMVHGQNQNGGESPDSGHNTSSSPVESASSPACTGRSCSEFEYSESSDLEGCERIERIRSKTAINTSRIPSMCVITPPGSDDEHARDAEHGEQYQGDKVERKGSVLMSATVGTSKMEVINGQDKNLYATVQTVVPSNDKALNTKISPLSGVLGKLRGVLPLSTKKTQQKVEYEKVANVDSGDYVTIADVRNNNDKRPDTTIIRSHATYANADLFRMDAEYVSLSELPKQPDSSLERKRQGARVTLDSEGKVVYSSDSLKRRKGAHTTFNPGPFVKEGGSPSASPLLHRAQTTVRAVTRSADHVDGDTKVAPPTSPQLGKLIIRAAKSPDRATSPDYVRTPTTVVSPTSPTSPHRQMRGAYVNVQGDEDNALLSIPSESVPVQAIAQPPPYLGQPHPQTPQNVQSYEEYCNEQQEKQSLLPQTSLSTSYEDQRNRVNNCQHERILHSHYPVQAYYNKDKCYKISDEKRKVYDKSSRKPEQQQLFDRVKEPTQQFYTLPSRKPQKEAESPRSVTPDITRGLNRAPLSAIQMLARQGHEPLFETFDRPRPIVANSYSDGGTKRMQSLPQQRHQPLDVRNRFATPLNLSALGYRFFASSPAHDVERKSPVVENLRQPSFSPIGPEKNSGFKSSTPTKSAAPIANHLTFSATRAPTPLGRNTPTNLILSPTKSTMSNEELFAAIHKSKKRLNIRDDADNLSPSGSLNVSVKSQAGSRHSWSPESHKTPEIPPTVQSPSTTSRMDFKRLLLQQSVKSGPTRLSAAEQLKMSRQQAQLQQHTLPSVQSNTLTKVLSPRSAWRFQTPRTDVLSSTIIEDAAAEEKAMKPSSTSRLSQTDLESQLQENKLLLDNLHNNPKQEKSNSISTTRPPKCQLQNTREEAESAISACESRRMSNQLARAQFLASASMKNNQHSLFTKRFRARSESPQHSVTQKVSRSPSAPALETAL